MMSTRIAPRRPGVRRWRIPCVDRTRSEDRWCARPPSGGRGTPWQRWTRQQWPHSAGRRAGLRVAQSGRSGMRKASTRMASGSGAIASTARRMASRDARWMFKVSISAGSTKHTDHASARAVMRSFRRSRSSALSIFESASPGMWASGSSTTAPATTGPARHPRPTSSQPAMR